MSKVKSILLPDQVQAIERIQAIADGQVGHCCSGVVLAKPWGSGKTLMSLASMLSRMNAGPILVLTELSPIQDWMDCCRLHFDPPLRSMVVNGHGRRSWYTLRDQQVIVANYEMLTAIYKQMCEERTALIEQELMKIDGLLTMTTNIEEDDDDDDDDGIYECREIDPHEERTQIEELQRRRAVFANFLTQHKQTPRLDLPIPDANLCSRHPFNALKQTTDERHMFYERQWPAIIADEGHVRRTFDTIGLTAVMQLRGDFRIVASATPFNNKLDDIVAEFTLGAIPPSFALTVGIGYARQIKLTPTSTLQQWKHGMSHLDEYCRELELCRDYFMIRGDRASFSRSHYQPVDIVIREPFYTKEERADYDALSKRHGLFGDNCYLRMACSGVFHPSDKTHTPSTPLPTKTLMLLEYLRVPYLRNEKVLVFCDFKESLAHVEDAVTNDFWMPVSPPAPVVRRSGLIKVFVASGETSPADRERIREEFSNYRGCAVLVSTNIFTQGVNLQCANHTVFYDSSWNPAKQAHARSRCERPTQTRSVFTVQLMITNTIEDRVWMVAQYKQQVNDEVMFGKITSNLLEKITGQHASTTILDDYRVSRKRSTPLRDVCSPFARMRISPPPSSSSSTDSSSDFDEKLLNMSPEALLHEITPHLTSKVDVADVIRETVDFFVDNARAYSFTEWIPPTQPLNLLVSEIPQAPALTPAELRQQRIQEAFAAMDSPKRHRGGTHVSFLYRSVKRSMSAESMNSKRAFTYWKNHSGRQQPSSLSSSPMATPHPPLPLPDVRALLVPVPKQQRHQLIRIPLNE